MRALPRLVFALLVVAACKGKSAEPTVGSAAAGSAAPTAGSGSATAAGSGSGTGSATAATPKVFDGPTFTVASTLPGPKLETKDIETEVAGKTTMTAYEFADPSDDNSVEMVETNPNPVKPGTISKVLENTIDGMTGAVKATVDEKHLVTIGSARGYDFNAHFIDEDGEFFMRGRVAIKDDTLYQVIALGKGEKPTPVADAFVESFSLK